MPTSSLQRDRQRTGALRWPLLSSCRSFAAACALLGLTGCYNGDVLVDQVRHDALRHRLEEVDLGRYSLTMPRDPATTATVEVELHLFGSLPRYRQKEVEECLEEKSYRLRHDTLLAIRESAPEDFTDPDLASLRSRLLAVTNSLLDEPSVKSVGFHEVRFTRQ